MSELPFHPVLFRKVLLLTTDREQYEYVGEKQMVPVSSLVAWVHPATDEYKQWREYGAIITIRFHLHDQTWYMVAKCNRIAVMVKNICRTIGKTETEVFVGAENWCRPEQHWIRDNELWREYQNPAVGKMSKMLYQLDDELVEVLQVVGVEKY